MHLGGVGDRNADSKLRNLEKKLEVRRKSLMVHKLEVCRKSLMVHM